MTIEELIECSHAMAVEKGWWEGGERSVADQANNFHAEISEAWEEYRAGRMETWYSIDGQQIEMDAQGEAVLRQTGRVAKPEGFWVEIADLCIRLADTMGAYGWTYRELRPCDHEQLTSIDWDIPRLISTLHVCVGCLNIHGNGEIGAGWEPECKLTASGTIHLCLLAARHHGVDLLSLCELKMAYNTTRSHRHGGKRA